MILKILTALIMTILLYTSYMQGYNDSPYKIINQTITKYVINGTTCENITEKTMYITDKKTQIIYEYKTMDITDDQKKWLLNDCQIKEGSWGVQIGSARTCDKIAEYLKIEGRPKYSTRPSTNYEIDNIEYIPVKTNGYGTKYINLSKEWYISNNLFETYNMSYILNLNMSNTTEYNNNTLWTRYKETGVYILHV